MFIDDSIITRLLSLKPSQRTDEALYYTLAPHLLGFWTFLKPKHNGEEIGDVLFIFQDVCIIFEAKTRETGEPTSTKWISQKLREAADQIKENHRKLSNGEVPTIRNPWRGLVNWGDLGVKYYIGVIVMMHNSDEYNPYTIAPEIFNGSIIPLHVISLMDISQLIRIVNTPMDFIIYWEFRYLFGKDFELPVQNENGIFWAIVQNWINLAKSQGTKQSEQMLIADQIFQENYAKVVLGSEGIDEGIKKDIAASFLIDIAAGSVMEKADKDPSGKRVGSEKHDLLIKTVEQLALIGRRRRALYGKIWVDCANESIKNGKDIFKFRFSPSRKTSYVICARNSIGQEAAPILELMRIRMLEDASKMVVGISATAENILYTYDQVLSSINRAERKNKNTSLILDGTVILLEKR